MKLKLVSLVLSAVLLSSCATPKKPVLPTFREAIVTTHKITLLDDSGERVGSCSGTAVSPTTLLTAAHCTEDLKRVQVDGKEVEIEKILDDKHDHSFIIFKKPAFDSWAFFASKAPLKGDSVWYNGNPANFENLLRRGMIVGVDNLSKDNAWLMDINGFMGDSGSAIFNSDNQIIGVISYMRVVNLNGPQLQFMGAFQIQFSEEDWCEALKGSSNVVGKCNPIS